MAELQNIHEYIYQAANLAIKRWYGSNNWANYITYDKVLSENATATLLENAAIGEVTRIVSSNYVDFKNDTSLQQSISTPQATESVTTTNSSSTSIGFNLGHEINAKVTPIPEALEIGGSTSFSFSFNRTQTNTVENSRSMTFPSQTIIVPPRTWTKGKLLILERTVRQNVKLDVDLSNYICIYARQSWAHGWWKDHPIYDLCAYEGIETGVPKPSGLTFPPKGTVSPGPQTKVHFNGLGFYEVKGALKIYMELQEYNIDGTPKPTATKIVEANPAFLPYGVGNVAGDNSVLTINGK
ncbi:ETX/MTX2 family pore-forming toxin [Paenibacillus zanthoxyli]|uniref:ETX/MTX2 family pore-forming toxin n=1 Tax=Paenibacillus zanthoxyli TaxID=369399 RepID=UPI00046F5261|nr:ETX/MTX2 family pore-forming toxin [Paenibacillus zanthoxyli]